MENNHLLPKLLTAPAYAKHMGVSTAAVYKAIKRLNPVYVGAAKMPFFDPDQPNPFKEKKPK